MVEDLNRQDANARGAVGSRVLGILIVAGLLGGGFFLLPQPGPSFGAPAGAARNPDSILAERTKGCEVCRRMANDILPGEFVHDAHEMPCATCHHPHTRRTDAQWKETCSSADCHPRAWTLTVMHRLDVEVFGTCTNCHKPHVWSADATDCMSCHGEGPAEPVAVAAFPGIPAFDHTSHTSVECATCHVTLDTHSSLRLASPDECMTCHHDPRAARDCRSCHGSEALAGGLTVDFVHAFARGAEPRGRLLGFDHADHADRACADCHSGDGRNRLITDCAGCHEEHHPVDADCAGCHAAPPPEDVHPLTVHWDGCEDSGCHAGSGLAMPAVNRNWCVACHGDKQDHYPTGGACVTCHLPPEGMP